jgi:hypothetical protein
MTADTTSRAPRPLLDHELEHICSYTVTLVDPPEVIGPVPGDLRINAYYGGGEIWGPRLRGRVLPVGADWLVLRTDGVGTVDIRCTLEAEDGGLIYVTVNGVIDFGPDGYQRFLSGELPPDGTPIRAASRFFTAHPDHAWLNRVSGLHIGQAVGSRGEIHYDVYAVR